MLLQILQATAKEYTKEASSGIKHASARVCSHLRWDAQYARTHLCDIITAPKVQSSKYHRGSDPAISATHTTTSTHSTN
jgi:hypothetical protein